MQYGTIAGINKQVSRIGQGTVMVGEADIDGGLRLLDAIFAEGCNLFDTAHIYGRGENERVVGRWVNSRGVREQVVIIGKGAHHTRDRNRLTDFDIRADVHDSLARFRFDYIDLYMLHRDDPGVPVATVVDVLNEFVRAGQIHAIGASNWSYHRIAEANEYARKAGLAGFAASSPQFSLAVPTDDIWDGCTSISGPAKAAERQWYAQQGMAVIAWSSLALGFMAGVVTPGDVGTSAGGQGGETKAATSFGTPDNFRRLDRARELAQRYEVSLTAIALAYVLAQPMNVFPLIGCNSGQEFREAKAAMSIKLTAAEVAYLELAGEGC